MWQATSQQLMDTQPGTHGRVPHMSQITWHWDGVGAVIVDGTLYDVGYGNPGGFNDCLIDSLRQCLGLDTDPRRVREDLVSAFADASDERARATHNSFLDLDSHWETLLRSLFAHNSCGVSKDCDLQLFCVIALCRDNVNMGNVLGHIHASRRLVVMNASDVHVDPRLPR